MNTAESQQEANVNLIALFNHEEVGSVSTTGAQSSLIPTVMSRLSPTAEALARTTAKSFLISSDMGHGIHPNYTSKYQENHRPRLNGGIILKTNASQKYTTGKLTACASSGYLALYIDAMGSFLVKRLLARRGGSVQEFEVRNDMYELPLLSRVDILLVFKGMWKHRRTLPLQKRSSVCLILVVGDFY
jgi:aspartyl aminopeptidase